MQVLLPSYAPVCWEGRKESENKPAASSSATTRHQRPSWDTWCGDRWGRGGGGALHTTHAQNISNMCMKHFRIIWGRSTRGVRHATRARAGFGSPKTTKQHQRCRDSIGIECKAHSGAARTRATTKGGNRPHEKIVCKRALRQLSYQRTVRYTPAHQCKRKSDNSQEPNDGVWN